MTGKVIFAAATVAALGHVFFDAWDSQIDWLGREFHLESLLDITDPATRGPMYSAANAVTRAANVSEVQGLVGTFDESAFKVQRDFLRYLRDDTYDMLSRVDDLQAQIEAWQPPEGSTGQEIAYHAREKALILSKIQVAEDALRAKLSEVNLMVLQYNQGTGMHEAEFQQLQDEVDDLQWELAGYASEVRSFR